MKQITALWVITFLFSSFIGRTQNDFIKTAYRVHFIYDQVLTPDSDEINGKFESAGIQLTCRWSHTPLRISRQTKSWVFPRLGTTQFTERQKSYRDGFFHENVPTSDKDIYLFFVQGDTNQYFTIPNKSIAFIGANHGQFSHLTVFKSIGIQLGIDPSSIDSITSIQDLSTDQVRMLKENKIPLRFYDDYENIETSNGRVAFYFWKENPDGTFLVNPLYPMEQLQHPFKQNHFFVYLDVTNPLFKPRFHLFGFHICLIHILAVLVTLILQFLTFRNINKRMLDSRFFKRMSYRFAKLLIWALAISSNIFAFYATEFYYTNYHMRFHEITSFHGKSQLELEHKLGDSFQFRTQDAVFAGSQLFRQIDHSWYAQREDRVLYFDVDSTNHARFLHARNVLELKTKKYKRRTQSHFVVFRFHDGNDKIIREKVYNHMGFELTNKLHLPDPAKRILVFVNGYRPVSTNQSMSDFLGTFQEKGVEFPDSKNQLFSMDRFAYWEPWNQFNERFQQRIQADEIWYADGHHSVSTSNHRSVINFAGTAAVYPKACKGNAHHCYRTKLPSNQLVKTMSLLATSPNYDGFDLRYQHGRIAGKNLLQVLNEAPNYSKNDTLYIVSHSMGHAYAMGMCAELRGNIQFGECYILAPENAIGKTFDVTPWKSVWQYGAVRTGKFKHAPCQQDGVAAQSLVKGLSLQQRIPFPSSHSKQMGFFDSHFVGYYTWIFDIPKGKSGYVPQH